jgi:hypothetical protein
MRQAKRHGYARASNALPLLELIAKLPPFLIGMEACSGAQNWAHGGTASLLDSLADLQV